MLKLKEIIRQLPSDEYELMEKEFVKTKAEKYRYLFNCYRKESVSDDEISEVLKLNANAYYTLKSRLYDKIRSRLSSVHNFEKSELMKVLAKIPEMCVQSPRETANAMLQQLEIDLVKHGMHNELLPVYSALKKINLYSPKYFTYSQQYNRQLAYSISVEKSEEVLSSFAKILNEFYLSSNVKTGEALFFLKEEISNVYELNQSKKIQLIRDLLFAQYFLFCKNDKGEDVESLLESCLEIVEQAPDPAAEKAYELAANSMLFALAVKQGKPKQAEKYLPTLEKDFKLLYQLNYLCCPAFFYEQYMIYCIQNGKKSQLQGDFSDILTDATDEFSLITSKYYNALAVHYAGNNKQAIQSLKKLVNDHSLLNLDKIEAEIKLTLGWFLILDKELEMADNVYKKILRKLKSGETEKFPQVSYLGKLFDFESNKDNSAKNLQRKKELLTLFLAGNNGVTKVLQALEFSLKDKFQI